MITFDDDEIKWAMAVSRSGKLTPEDKNRMDEIYKSKLNPNHQPCNGCSQAVKENFKRLIQLMCESRGVTNL